MVIYREQVSRAWSLTALLARSARFEACAAWHAGEVQPVPVRCASFGYLLLSSAKSSSACGGDERPPGPASIVLGDSGVSSQRRAGASVVTTL